MPLQALSALDSAFLYLETPATPMHIASMHVLAVPKAGKRGFTESVRKHMRSRLPLAPALTRVLRKLPLNLTSPFWESAKRVDLRYHVRTLRLPAPGGKQELEALIGRLHGELMDRSRPLWRMTVIEGLGAELQTETDAHCVGLYSQVHHAAVDGQGGIALAQAILDLSPQGRDAVSKPRSMKKVELGLAEVLSGAISHQLAQAVDIARRAPSTLRLLNQMRKAMGEADGGSEPSATSHGTDRASKAASRLPIAPRTRFNRAVDGSRAFSHTSIPLAELKQFGKSHEASINDVVMCVIAGALRDYLSGHGGVPEQPLVAAMPISLRASGDTRSNNQASMTTFALPTHLATPRARLAAITRKTRAMKSSMGGLRGVMPTDFPTLGFPWLVSSLSKVYARTRMANRVPPVANVVISNVPGPQFPLYLAGAKLLSYVPVSIVAQGLALNITVQSYDGQLHFGLVSCAKTVPDTTDFAAALQRAWRMLS